MSEHEEVDNYRYLWDGSQPGWVLNCLSGRYVEVSLIFGPTGPSNAELMAVRRTIADYKSQPLDQLSARLCGCQSLSVGRFVPDEARIIAARCRQQDLRVVEEAIPAPRYVPTNRLTRTVLLIEDDVLANQVFASALQHGVPVVHTGF